MTPTIQDSEGTGRWRLIAARGLLMLLIWALLSNGDAAAWWIGVPAVLLASLISIRMLPASGFRWLELLRFMPFFIVHSLRGGVDVARRVFRPDLPIAPARIEYPLALPPGPGRALMASVVNLLPGTLCIEFDDHCMRLHVLDGRQSFEQELQAVERRVARIFSIQLAANVKESSP